MNFWSLSVCLCTRFALALSLIVLVTLRCREREREREGPTARYATPGPRPRAARMPLHPPQARPRHHSTHAAACAPARDPGGLGLAARPPSTHGAPTTQVLHLRTHILLPPAPSIDFALPTLPDRLHHPLVSLHTETCIHACGVPISRPPQHCFCASDLRHTL